MFSYTAKFSKKCKPVFITAVVIYGCLCCILYYLQLKNYAEGTGLFEADTPVHVSMAVVDHFYYSITAFVYLLCSHFSFANILIAIFLGAITAVTVPLTAGLVNECIKIWGGEPDDLVAYVLAFVSNFVMGFYIKAANVQHYIGYQNANMWHNSTYIVMRFAAVLVLTSYLKIAQKKAVGWKDWIIFSLLLAFSTAVKPSFLIVFAPIMAVELVIDLVKKVPFKTLFFFGCSVIPSLIVLLWQSLVLFGDDTGNGYAISPFTALMQRGDHPKVTLILSVLFPLIVFLAHVRDFYRDRLYSFSLLVWLMGFSEVFLFTETGTRGGDSNFMWGYSIALFVLFLVSMVKLVFDYKKKTDKKALDVIYLCVATFTLVWHAVSGIWYFVLLFSGVTYFI